VTSEADAIRAIDWSQYETAYGSASGVAEDLIALFDAPPRSTEAASRLWAGLCHQHAYVSSAALPALKFILRALQQADEQLQIELLDILLGFANCTWPPGKAKAPAWKHELYEKLSSSAAEIRPFTRSRNEEVRGFAGDILEALGQSAA
jgi:hypothetical protein